MVLSDFYGVIVVDWWAQMKKPCALKALGLSFVLTNQSYKQSLLYHYGDVIMGTIESQITSLTIVYSNVYSGADQGKHQSSASLAFVRGIHRDRWIPHIKGQ